MDQPVIVVLDEDQASRDRTVAVLERRYGADYRIVVASAPGDALHRLSELAASGWEVALILATRSAGGAAVLAAARVEHRQARRALLLDWRESRAEREHIVRVLSRGEADYVVERPIAPLDERFHRDITEFLNEWWRLRGAPYPAIRVIGEARSARSHEICDLLQRHDLPYGFLDAESEAGRTGLGEVGLGSDRLPVVVVGGGRVLIEPSNVEVAEALGARTRPGPGTYDAVIVGAGPAGLAAAVNASSEGLRTLLLERVAMGGQAGTSSLIRNYLGFPRGISGAELTARTLDQAILLGTEMAYGGEVVSLRADGDLRVVGLRDGSEVPARTVVVATGVSYRRLDVPELHSFTGVGVLYGAATSEARSLSGERVYVVGGGNSAGQAALHLAKYAATVTILVRSGSVAHSMSRYLINEIELTPNLSVRYGVQVVGGGGRARLEWLAQKDVGSGVVEQVPAAALFVLIGAEPFTGWLPPAIARDDWGYLLTGPEVPASVPSARRLPFETSSPGVFAVGDVRHGSVKRVASAAGEGSVCVSFIHEYLAGGR